MSDYEARAQAFLRTNRIGFAVKYLDSACPPFCDDSKHIHGDRYRVTLTREADQRRSISFEFWNSYNDSRAGREPRAYDVLASISSDYYCPDTFEDFCSEFGYDADSRKAEATFKRCRAFAVKLQRFFTGPEAASLSEIQ